MQLTRPFPTPNALTRVTSPMMNIAQAKCIPLDSYLGRQGIKPQKSRQGGRELWYHSPIRQNDANPSFKVDTVKNLWFDHGMAKGGTIIDLVRELYAYDVRETLRHLEKTGIYSPALTAPSTDTSTQTRISRGASRPNEAARGKRGAADEKEKTGAFELVASQPLKHPALLQYLDTRGIDHDIARKYVSQIDFKRPGSAGNYFALGYPAGGGFEARNAIFKGFVGSGKALTFHDHKNSDVLQVFEGFMDFLSYLTAKKLPEAPATTIVLNTTNLWRSALPYIDDTRFREVRLFLDNDQAGDSITRAIFETVKNTKNLHDMRKRYADYDDLNDWLCDQKA